MVGQALTAHQQYIHKIRAIRLRKGFSLEEMLRRMYPSAPEGSLSFVCLEYREVVPPIGDSFYGRLQFITKCTDEERAHLQQLDLQSIRE